MHLQRQAQNRNCTLSLSSSWGFLYMGSFIRMNLVVSLIRLDVRLLGLKLETSNVSSSSSI